MLGLHALKGWSKTEALITLGSGESKLYATLKTSAETLKVNGTVEGPWIQSVNGNMG